MQKENPVANSARPIQIRCAKYKFAVRSHNFLMHLPMQLIFGDLWDLDKFQTCAKGKSILEFHSMSKEIQKMQKSATEQKKYQKWFDGAALWRVDVYLISSTSMQKENPVANSVRQIKIRCAKYKFVERSHNFLMQLPMQLIFGERWDLDKLQTSAKGNPKLQKIAIEQNSTQNGLTEPPFGEYMFIWLVRHPCKRKIQ